MLLPDCVLNKKGWHVSAGSFCLFALNNFCINEIDAGVAKKLHKMNNSD